MLFTQAGGHRLEYRRIDGSRAPIVMLHEGLGSVALWKRFPDEVARATGRAVFVYSRYGHGLSDALTGPRDVRYMHEEALVALPGFLDALGIENPILLGHSDGASIALIYAGAKPDAISGLIVLAPHVFVEDLAVASIAAKKRAYETTDLPTKLARYHADADGLFRGWNSIWLDPAFRSWNIEAYLPSIAVPVLAIQGVDDEFGTMEQVHRVAHGTRDVKVIELEDCAHSPHRDQPARTLAALADYVRARPVDCAASRDRGDLTP
jgi:pimeloyl-ACP methyl ester carboxylesterase